MVVVSDKDGSWGMIQCPVACSEMQEAIFKELQFAKNFINEEINLVLDPPERNIALLTMPALKLVKTHVGLLTYKTSK